MAYTTFLFTARNAAGVSYSGAKANCYVKGTTTRRAVYTDSGLTVEATNPVVADSEGKFTFYLDGSLEYTIQLTDASGVSLSTQFDYDSSGWTLDAPANLWDSYAQQINADKAAIEQTAADSDAINWVNQNRQSVLDAAALVDAINDKDLSAADRIALEPFAPPLTRGNLTGNDAISSFTPTSVADDGNGHAKITATAHGIIADAETAKSLTSVANNGSGAPRFTATAHGLSTDHVAVIAGTTNYDRAYKVTKIDDDTFDLQGESYTAETLSGATVARHHAQTVKLGGTTNYDGVHTAVALDTNSLLLYDTNYQAETLSSATGLWMQYYHVPGITATGTPGELIAVVLTNPGNSAESRPGQRVVVNRSTDRGDTWSGWNPELNSAVWSNTPLTFDASARQQGEPHIKYIPHLNEVWLVFVHQDPDNASVLCKLDMSETNPKWNIQRLEFDQTTQEPRYSSRISGSPNSGKSLTQTIFGVAGYRAILYRPIIDDAGRIAFSTIWLKSWRLTHFAGDFWTEDDGETWQWAVIPRGNMGSGDAWENCKLQTRDGRYRTQIRDLGGTENTLQAVSESATLRDWSPASHIRANWHSNKMIFQKVRDDLYFGMGTIHSGNRNAMSLLVSWDGVVFTAGFQLDDVVDGEGFAHYPAFDTDDEYFYGLITVGNASPPTVNGVRFVRFALPQKGKLPAMGNAKNSVEDNVTNKTSYIDGNDLVVPSGAMAQLPMGGLKVAYGLRMRVSALPATHPVRLLTFGRGDNIGRLELRSSGDAYVVDQHGNETLLTTISSPSEGFDLAIALDRDRRIAKINQVEITLPEYAVLGIGDMTNSAANDPGVAIYCELDKSYLRPMDALGNAIGGNSETVDDLYVNGDLRHQSGDLISYDGLIINDRRGDSADAAIRLLRDTGKAAWLQIFENGFGAWFVGVDADGQLKFRRRDASDGSYVDDPLVINEDTGLVTLSNGLNVTSIAATGRISTTDFMNFGPATDVTISGGAITATRSHMRVDTEGGASTDDLDTINGGQDGDWLMLRTESSSRDVTMKHGTGNIFCGSDRTLNNVADWILLVNQSSQWRMMAFADN